MVFDSVRGCRWNCGDRGAVDEGVKETDLANDKTTTVRLVVEEVSCVAPLAVLLERSRDCADSFVLGDFGGGKPGRFSYLGLEPIELLEFSGSDSGDPFDLLQAACDKYRLDDCGELPVPFVGGWVGYLSYDLGRYVEQLPDEVEHDIDMPLMRFGFFDTLAGWDGQLGRGYLLALEYAGQQDSASKRIEKLREICSAEGGAKSATVKLDEVGAAETGVDETLEIIRQMECNISRGDYLTKVVQAVEYIKAGDIFEVNLSQRFSCGYGSDAAVLYEYLTRHNPAGYSALLRGGEDAVVSASPELFLSLRGREMVTRPIKGTIPRGAGEKADRANREWLEASEKDRAELNMIIDLERNDLGRVCEFGSVEVIREREIEQHPTVFHAVATVAGVLRADVCVAEVLRATFPGGSISGAPKIRAMEIIDELEPTARGVYTGSIGWIGVNGDLDLNIAIRTVILAAKRAFVQVGGAVVADSEEQAEYDETLAKAAALVRALWATGAGDESAGKKITEKVKVKTNE